MLKHEHVRDKRFTNQIGYEDFPLRKKQRSNQPIRSIDNRGETLLVAGMNCIARR